jgi:hypothetical protein
VDVKVERFEPEQLHRIRTAPHGTVLSKGLLKEGERGEEGRDEGWWGERRRGRGDIEVRGM